MNSFYMNRLIKIVSPINEEIFTIQLGGSEEELKELIGTILNINPQSIKGIRDSFGNYHTISSAIMNKNLTMGYSQFYYIVINNNQNSITSPHNNNNTMILEKNNLNFYQNYNFGNKSLIIKNKEDDNFNNLNDQNEKIAFRLFNENLIDKNKYDLLKKMLIEQNDEILTLFKLYINHGKDIKKLSKQIYPILNNPNFPMKNNSNKIEEAIKNVTINNINFNNNNSNRYMNILNSIRNIFNYNDSEVDLLKKLLLCDNGYIIKAFEDYSLTNNQKTFKSSLDLLIKNYSERFLETTINDNNIINNNNNKNKENDKKGNTKRTKLKSSTPKEKKISKKTEKIEKKILKLFSSEEANFQQDCILLFKADMQKLTLNEKLNLFTNEFKIKETNSPINSNSKNLIKEYYKNQLKNKYFKNFNPNEISIYEELIKSNNENIINAYKNFIKNKNSDELSSEIRKWILKILEERELLENNTSSNLSEEEESENEENESEEYENEESENEESENINEEVKKEEEEEEESSLHSSTSEAMNNTSESDSENERKIKKINTNNNSNLNNRGSFIINKTSRKKYDASQLLNNNYRIHTLRKLNNDEKKNNINNNSNSNNNINNNIDHQEQKLTLVSLKKAEEIANENSRREHNKLLINMPSPDRKINEFIKVINGMNIDENSKYQILQLINNKNEEIMKIYEKYQKNKLYLTKKVLLNLLSKNELHDNSNNNINTNNTNKSHNSKKNNTLSFENFLKNLENENRLTKPKVQFLIKEFNSGNNMIQSFWEVYKKEKDENELKENIEIFLQKYENKFKTDKQSKNSVSKEMTGGKTPLSIQSFKKDLVNYLKTTERKETKTKQKKIIDLLIKEHFLNPSSQKFFYEKISNEVKEVTAAFEVFSVTLNHIDFSETLNIIYDLVIEGYKDDSSKKSKDDNSKRNKDNNSKKNNKEEFLIRLNKVLDKGKFNDNEKKIIKEEFDKVNNVLMSILEVFDEDDIEDTIDSIKSFVAKIIHTKGL